MATLATDRRRLSESFLVNEKNLSSCWNPLRFKNPLLPASSVIRWLVYPLAVQVSSRSWYLLSLSLSLCAGVPQAAMLEYPLHGRLHSFLVLKRKCMLSGNSQTWHGWTQRNSERGVAEVSTRSPSLSLESSRWCLLCKMDCVLCETDVSALFVYLLYIIATNLHITWTCVMCTLFSQTLGGVVCGLLIPRTLPLSPSIDSQAVKTDLTSLSPMLADSEFRCRPYSRPLNSTFTDTDLLLFALQIASAMDHLTQRNVREGPSVHVTHVWGLEVVYRVFITANTAFSLCSSECGLVDMAN